MVRVLVLDENGNPVDIIEVEEGLTRPGWRDEIRAWRADGPVDLYQVADSRRLVEVEPVEPRRRVDRPGGQELIDRLDSVLADGGMQGDPGAEPTDGYFGPDPAAAGMESNAPISVQTGRWEEVALEAWALLTGEQQLPGWFDELATVGEMARRAGVSRDDVKDALDRAMSYGSTCALPGCECRGAFNGAPVPGRDRRVEPTDYASPSWEEVAQEFGLIMPGRPEPVDMSELVASLEESGAVEQITESMLADGALWTPEQFRNVEAATGWADQQNADPIGDLVAALDAFEELCNRPSETMMGALDALVSAPEPWDGEPRNRAERRGRRDRPGHVSPHGPRR